MFTKSTCIKFSCLLMLIIMILACSIIPQKSEPAKEAGATEQNGMKMAVLGIEDPANLNTKYSKKSPDKRLIAVNIYIENTSYTSSFPLDPAIVLTPYTNVNEPAKVISQIIHDDQLTTTKLIKGNKISGWVIFEVPTGQKITSIDLVDKGTTILTVKPVQ
jgi:hypothetical protein